MSYPDSHDSFMSPQASYQPGSDAIGVSPQFVTNNNEQFEHHHHQPPYKRPRNSEDNPNQSMNSRPPPTSNIPVHKGPTNIFFKTRVCAKFKTGTCRNGENCNFAHGMQDLRQPPPNWKELVGVSVNSEEDRSIATNWEDDQRIIHKMKLCKKFYNGEECPYGDRCNFLHEDPSKFREDTGRFRESSAISIGTTGQAMGNVSGVFNAAEVNRPANNAVIDATRSNIIKPVYWKTKLCTKWEITGQCPFGEKCHFAHGLAELQAPGGRTEVEAGNAGSILTKVPPPVLPNNVSPSMTANVPGLIEEEQSKKSLLKWKGQKKINRIYADWLDDLPLVHNLTNQLDHFSSLLDMAINTPLSFSLLPSLTFILLTLSSHELSIEKASICDPQHAFKQNQLTSRKLVEFYVGETNRLNPILKGVMETNPDALFQANNADYERRIKSPGSLVSLHGIPILLKDNIATMKAGAIILGKASLNEWPGFMSFKAPGGSSARGGQGEVVYNPYLLSADPCGSISGSAISVAANLVAVSLGNENDGSIICPSNANSAVGIKPTVGLTSRAGVIPISLRPDTDG
ncbi:hypothetical protein SADUNF_Sadunf09G0106400 [Salix dunnii]|uniref:C3H1-type domain-containing protein n=1 Tax=Salix dunnii TaxID=1413687 RepID=A0A835MRF2_9ROSI|nr:hypothetical protein SADUNF_Sadunf09G0106400 [Salix dunnii]